MTPKESEDYDSKETVNFKNFCVTVQVLNTYAKKLFHSGFSELIMLFEDNLYCLSEASL